MSNLQQGSGRSAPRSRGAGFRFHFLTAKRWPDLERLFGDRGACGGCWCMMWRSKRGDFERRKGVANKRALRRIVESRRPVGVIAYHRGQPVGWCAIAPREDYPALGRSRILRPVDDQPVWSVSCFFIARGYRRRGLSAELLGAAVDCGRERGAKIVEGYPIEPSKHSAPDVFAWTGIASAFRNAGFQEVARRSPGRPLMRKNVPVIEPHLGDRYSASK